MSEAREAVLASIRESLGRAKLDPEIERALDKSLASPRPNLLPRVDGELVARFAERAAVLSTTIANAATLEEVPAVVATYVAQGNLPTRLIVGADLAGLPWPAPLQVAAGVAAKDDLVSVTNCFAAVAETGSLVLLSGQRSPTTLNFVPDNHIVIVRRDQVVRHIEEVWARLRAAGDLLPRTINVISGPSRTGDVEQTIQLGAHGPRRLHVILVET